MFVFMVSAAADFHTNDIYLIKPALISMGVIAAMLIYWITRCKK
jgi:hypothetical protein